MTVQYLNIEEKHTSGTGAMVTLANFTVSEGAEFDANIVLNNSNLSLYFLDDVSQQAVFVELPPDIDLASVPFVYQTQWDHAQRLVAMPYDTFRQLAHQLPEAKQLILMFSSGRSGSTLMSNILNQLNDVMSLSEPDAANQFIHLRGKNGSRDAEMSDLLTCTMRMLFKPSPFKAPTICSVKFRGETSEVMDLFYKTFPQAKYLYLYRDAIGFVTSFLRLTRNAHFPETQSVDEFLAGFATIADFSPMLAYLDPGAAQITLVEILTLWWLNNIQQYLTQYDSGIPILAVRYADLNAHREPMLKAIFDYCGLPTEQIAQALRAFDHDSQAGSFLAREKPTEGNAYRATDEEINEVMRILQRHPVIKVSDFIAPGTLSL